jgi:hypothetical protein
VSVDPQRLRTFIEESLALWCVDATVESGQAPVVAEIRAANGTIVWVEPAQPGVPFRWIARSRSARDSIDGAREPRPRPCGSLVGLLNAIRKALDVERGSALRIAPTPDNV